MKEHDPLKEIHRVRRMMAREAGYEVAEYIRQLQEYERELRQRGRVKFHPSAEATKQVAETAMKYSAKKRMTKKK